MHGTRNLNRDTPLWQCYNFFLVSLEFPFLLSYNSFPKQCRLRAVTADVLFWPDVLINMATPSRDILRGVKRVGSRRSNVLFKRFVL